MARISSYPRDLDIVDDDAWIGTESSNRLTRNFTAAAVAKYLNIKGKISISAQMVFKFVLQAIPANGEFSGPADGSNMGSITTLEVSGLDASGQNTVQFMEYLVNNDILISKQNDISTFGHFTIDSYTSNGGVYTLALTLVGGGSNGVISENVFYDFAVFTLSSGLADKTFEYQQVTPSTTWNIAHNLGKFPSITVIDTGDTVVTGQYTYIDNNNVTLTFSAAFAGKAYLN
jgi:hypothetical protein